MIRLGIAGGLALAIAGALWRHASAHQPALCVNGWPVKRRLHMAAWRHGTASDATTRYRWGWADPTQPTMCSIKTPADAQTKDRVE